MARDYERQKKIPLDTRIKRSLTFKKTIESVGLQIQNTSINAIRKQF
jgi:hypothetical protein